MFAMNLTLKRTTSDDPDFKRLAAELTAFLAELNGEANDFYAPHNKSDGIPTVVVAYADAQAVGCGAFRTVDEKVVEVKRMYVDPSSRGQGIGAAVLSELEKWSFELGAQRAILETSRRLESAVRLYERSGYRRIDNYEPYVGVEDSVCFEKRLNATT